MRPTHRRVFAAAALMAVVVLSGCSGGGGSAALEVSSVDSGLAPKSNGFSFANFGSAATPEVFNESDLVTMFGDAACVDGVTSPCTPTAQAAQWAQMVNEARASGHCEGLAVQSASRFMGALTPQTVDLRNEGDVTHGIMRAFATQFFPEVQAESNKWAKKSLNDILNELGRSFTAKDVSYTMGLYTPSGGHAVLPYALQIDDKLAVVKVYDSNWPGMERYVVIDLATETWYFSFSASDPQKDECAWTGKAGDIDLAPMSARTDALCPFCGNDAKVTKNVLFIRSASLDWSVKTPKGTYSPGAGETTEDVRARAVRTATCEQTVRLPEFVLYTEAEEFELDLPDTSSAYVSNGDAVVRVVTTGKKKRNAVLFGKNTVSSQDESTTLTVAADNVVARIEVSEAAVTIGENLVTIETAGTEVKADTAAPQIVVTDGPGEAPPTVTETKELVTVVPEVPKELVPDPVKPGLTAAAERDLSNEVYAAAIETLTVRNAALPPTPTTTAAPTTTTIAEATTTVAPTTTKKPATAVAATTTTVKATTTTAAAATTQAPTTTSPILAAGNTTTTVRATTTTLRTTATTTASATTTTTDPPATTTTVRATTTTAAPATTTTQAATTTTAYVHPYLRNYGCPYVYVGPSYDGSTGQSGVNTEATGRCNSGWEDIQGTITWDGTTRTINYSYQFRTCSTVTYSLRVRYSNGTLSQVFTGSYTPPQDNC